PRQTPTSESIPMTICPIAIAVGCKKCPAFSVCPLTRVLGDQPAKPEKDAETPKPATKPAAGKKQRK
ncbi:MAG: hypothetical protein H6Q02_2725, partial [Acidobacteria bacterium]|nr:hypothetical protein [Acidobacteriota bacterium]